LENFTTATTTFFIKILHFLYGGALNKIRLIIHHQTKISLISLQHYGE